MAKVKTSKAGQLELGLPRPEENDRNFEKEGRSFYFFDFDDNIMNLSTPIIIFHKDTNEEKLISSHELASEGSNIGKSGVFADYKFDYDDEKGSFRYFRDKNINFMQKMLGQKQSFVNDLLDALTNPEWVWKGPSWNFFYHATFNKRPISIITARGHAPNTIKDGIKELVKLGHLKHTPNYLCVYPVSNPDIRKVLGDKNSNSSTAELKKIAIFRSVEAAILRYGENPHHRFGMSDDDPKNVQLITEAMVELKKKYLKMSFFVIDTHDGQCIKKEIFEDHFEEKNYEKGSFESISLFDL